MVDMELMNLGSSGSAECLSTEILKSGILIDEFLNF